jgi:DNA-directed RNA polymerase subunit RPC12/RpoP
MNENISSRCRNCGAALQSEKEKEINVCFDCRRFGLIYGRWPEASVRSASLEPVTNAAQ